MDKYQWIIVIIWIFTLIFYFKIARALAMTVNDHSFLCLGGLLLISWLCLALVIILAKTNQTLREENKGKCPEYERIENVYILKK